MLQPLSADPDGDVVVLTVIVRRSLFPTMGFVPRKRIAAERARLESADSVGSVTRGGSQKKVGMKGGRESGDR